MKKRIFLTGVSGYLGSVLAQYLANQPEIESITGIDITPPLTPLPPNVQFQKMDIRSPDLAKTMAGHDVVIHTAFIVQWLAKMPAAVRDDINLNGTRNVAQAAATNKVRSFIHASSVAAYQTDANAGKFGVTEDYPIGKGDSFFYYGNSKANAERILTEILGSSGISLTFLRPNYIIGPCNRTTLEGFRENPVNFKGYNARMQFVHEEDVASAFLLALRNDMPGAYNVVPDDFILISDFLKIIGVQTVRTVPVWLARLVTAVKWRYFGSMVHPSWVMVNLGDSTFSNAKLKAEGWKPLFGSSEAVRSAL